MSLSIGQGGPMLRNRDLEITVPKHRISNAFVVLNLPRTGMKLTLNSLQEGHRHSVHAHMHVSSVLRQ